jgi:hypothetical protein
MFKNKGCSQKMNIEQLEHNLSIIQKQICSMIEHPEQVTIENVQQLKLPLVEVNSDLINRLTEYSDKRINDKSLL